jgi:hypothetical protein
MSIPFGAGVKHRLTGRLGRTLRGPRKASRGMLWVQWDGKPAPGWCQRAFVVYVARHYTTALAWQSAAEMTAIELLRRELAEGRQRELPLLPHG